MPGSWRGISLVMLPFGSPVGEKEFSLQKHYKNVQIGRKVRQKTFFELLLLSNLFFVWNVTLIGNGKRYHLPSRWAGKIIDYNDDSSDEGNQHVTQRPNEKNEKNENIPSKSDATDVFWHFTVRNFAFYAIFDVADFLVNFVFSRKEKLKVERKSTTSKIA